MQIITRTALVAVLLGCVCNAHAGDITGRVLFKGAPPPESTVDLTLHAALAAKHPKGLMSRHYVVGRDGGLRNVLVYVRGDFGSMKFESARAPLVLDHVDGFFQPYVLGVQVGQQMELKCSDSTTCGFHAMPKANRGFVIAPFLNKGASCTFTEPEVPVRFICDLHPWNFAYVGVFAHPFFTVTDEQGRFAIRGVPPGRHTLEIFHPKSGTNAKPLVVTRGATNVAFEITEAAGARAGEAEAEGPTAAPARVAAKPDRYTIHAGGDLYVGFTNYPASNPVTIAFSRWRVGDSSSRVAVFRLTNSENRSVLLWNVRVEVPSTGFTPQVSDLAAIHAGWETAHNDYPSGTNAPHIDAGESGEFAVDWPGRSPWRVCIIYSKEWIGDERKPPVSGRQWGGDYEVIGPQMKE